MVRDGDKIHLTRAELAAFQVNYTVRAQSPMTVMQYNQLIEDEALFFECAQTSEGDLMAAITRLGKIAGGEAMTAGGALAVASAKRPPMTEERNAGLVESMRKKHSQRARAAEINRNFGCSSDRLN